jgi:hypothetical protein
MQLEEHSGSSPDQELNAAEQVVDNSNKTGETEESLLSVVQSVAQETVQAESNDSLSESPPEELNQESGQEQSNPQQEDDYSKLPFHEHPRFKKLVAQKHAFREQAQAFESDAKQYREIQSFMDANGLSAHDAAEALALMAQIKSGDPAKAYEVLTQKAESLATLAGKKLPQDLEERVEQGYVDRDTAQELHQQRVTAERQAAAAQRQLEQRSQVDQRQQTLSIAQAVQTWEAATKANDPDFGLKVDLVKDRVRAHIATAGMPRTVDEAVRVSKDAYDSVSDILRRAQGPKQSMRPAVGGKVNGSAAPEPRNLLDVIRRASAGA